MNDFLKLIPVAIFLLYINYLKLPTIDAIFNSFSVFESVLAYLTMLSISLFLGYTHVTNGPKEPILDVPSRLYYDATGKTNGIDPGKYLQIVDRRLNYPASTDCINKIKSYFVFGHLGGVLTLVVVGIFLLYLAAEVDYRNTTAFLVGMILAFVAEGSLIRSVLIRHDAMTRFIGSSSLGLNWVRERFLDTLYRSVVTMLIGLSFIALSIFSITAFDNIVVFVDHKEALWLISKMFFFTGLAAGVGWVGTAWFMILPHISERYRNSEPPEIKESVFTDISVEDNGEIIFHTASNEESE